MVFDPARYDYTNALFQLSIRLSKAVKWKEGEGRGQLYEGRRDEGKNMEFGTEKSLFLAFVRGIRKKWEKKYSGMNERKNKKEKEGKRKGGKKICEERQERE